MLIDVDGIRNQVSCNLQDQLLYIVCEAWSTYKIKCFMHLIALLLGCWILLLLIGFLQWFQENQNILLFLSLTTKYLCFLLKRALDKWITLRPTIHSQKSGKKLLLPHKHFFSELRLAASGSILVDRKFSVTVSEENSGSWTHYTSPCAPQNIGNNHEVTSHGTLCILGTTYLPKRLEKNNMHIKIAKLQ